MHLWGLSTACLLGVPCVATALPTRDGTPSTDERRSVSVRTLAAVWDHSRHAGPHLLMMLAIADFADDDGRAFPAVAKLAEKCRMKPRNAQTLLAVLRASGELEVLEGEGPRGTNLFHIRLDRLRAQPDPLGVQALAGGVQELAGVQSLAGGVQTLAGVGVQRLAHRGASSCASPISMNRHEPVEARIARPHPPDGTASTPRGTRLPTDWQLPEDWREWCLENRPDLDPDATAECFRDHWHAKSGRDATKVDWLVTWRNWCRRERSMPASSGADRSAGRTSLSTDHVFTLEE